MKNGILLISCLGWWVVPSATPASGEITFLKTWGRTGDANGEFRFPAGVAVASTSEVYVADTINHRVQRFFDSDAWTSVPSPGRPWDWRGRDDGGLSDVRLESWLGADANVSIHSNRTLTVADGGQL